MAKVPRHFHFVFGLREQDEPFHLMHYLCLESCRRTQAPERIFFHCRHLPYGPLWDRIAPHLDIRRVGERPRGFDPSLYQQSAEGRFIADRGYVYAHEADFIRLEALIQHGGIYADMDTLFVQRYDDALLTHDCVLGEEAAMPDTTTGVLRPSLCNAVIIAQANAPFLLQWQALARQEFDGTWSRHSCQAASQLWMSNPGLVQVAPLWRFYGLGSSIAGLKSLFEVDAPLPPGALSLHLWAHLWWSADRTDFSAFHQGLLNEDYVRAGATTYARLARPWLEPDA
ncbi:MAG: glycosyl transferase [Burkholderiales bacterium]|nr:glycosyl transferase [Burkholderiales bacterium]MBK8666465.1 glycosyl transferase [Burkholderiales bacterium]